VEEGEAEEDEGEEGVIESGGAIFADDLRMTHTSMEGAQVGCDVTADVQMFAGLELQTVKCWLRAGEGGPGEGGRRQAGVSARDIQRKRIWYRKMDILDGGG